VSHDARVASVRKRQSRNDADECGFAGAVRAEQPEELALLYTQADAAECLHRPIVLGDTIDLDCGRHSIQM
jgi:hypothetical protein